MKYEFQRISTNPAIDLLDAYEVPSTRPSFRIEEYDLYEIMTDKQIKAWENGATILNISQSTLFIYCKQSFPKY